MTGPVTACQSCGSAKLETILSLGSLPACNSFVPIGAPDCPELFYPHDLLKCESCQLVQLGYLPSQTETFPVSYPYTSSTTKALRDNFADLAAEVASLHPMAPEDLVVDIGGNDGNLLSNFVGKHQVLNVTPEDIGQLGLDRGIPHLQRYWDKATASLVVSGRGKAKLITATNVFAHVPDPNEFVQSVLSCLTDDGVFVTESHYLGAILKGNQWDAIYGEHARYLSLESIRNILERHGLTIAYSREIDSHGGSIRVYACRPDYARQVVERVKGISKGRWRTEDHIYPHDFENFTRRVSQSKRDLWRLLSSIKEMGGRIFGIGAPSRASTLINYVGIDQNVLDCICEIDGSHKIGKYMPGTRIPVVSESALYEQKPEYALMLNHHLCDTMVYKIRQSGYAGKFIRPLPDVEVIQ